MTLSWVSRNPVIKALQLNAYESAIEFCWNDVRTILPYTDITLGGSAFFALDCLRQTYAKKATKSPT